MPLPTIYNTGTASVANGATTLTIVGAVSNAIYAGDFFMDPAQPLVPPQRIASVTGGGVYELAVGWPGTTMVAAPYVVHITPDSVRVQERTRAVLEGLDQRGLPQGGDAGQVLAKVSGDDYAVAWIDDEVGGGTAADIAFTPTGDLTSTDTQAAIVEVNGKIAAAAAGVARRGTVRAAATANITISTALNNGDTLDGVTLATGDLVLVKNQAAPAENGVYVVGTSPARSSEFDTYNEHPGTLIVVQEGSTLADSFWYCTSNAGGTLGSTGIVFAQLSLTPADGSITYAKMAAGVIREKLAANRTYYVRSDGSDSSTGLANTSGGAFLTMQRALDVAATLDCSIYNVTVQVGNGTYTASASLPRMLGSGTFTLRGDPTTPSNVIISTTGASAIVLSSGEKWTVLGFRLQTTTSGSALDVTSGELYFGNIVFGASASSHIYVTGANARAIKFANYTVSGNAVTHITAQNGGYLYNGGVTITFTQNVTFSLATIYENAGSIVSIDGSTFTLGGFTVTGQRYNISALSILNTAAGGANYIPGSTAGAANSGSQYT